MPVPLPDDTQDLAACHALLRGGSRSFFAASFLLPRRIARPACALYAFCRLADDAIDLNGGKAETLEHWRQRLAQVYAGQPLPVPADRALAGVVRQFQIPRVLFEALLEGFEWDAAGRRYDTLSDLYGYCARVAGTVGAMMAMLMGIRDATVAARACDLGVAMQLTNIARDVGEDARAGRLYLPRSWLREAGIDPQAWLAAPDFSPALGAVVQRLLETAETLYRRADAGIAQLPPACRPGIHAARRLYAEIGREVERRGLDSISQRATVSAGRKAGLLGQVMTATLRPAPWEPAPPLAETRFLVEAVAAAPAAIDHRNPTIGQRAVWLIDLFERLERMERLERARSG